MDYTFIQNSENFNFYGLFSYFKLSFQQDLQLSQMIQKAKEEDTLEKRISDPEFSYNPKLFSIANYPKINLDENLRLIRKLQGLILNHKSSVSQNIRKRILSKKQCLANYMGYNLRINIFMFQVFDLYFINLQLLSKVFNKSRRLYPWVAFEVFLKKKLLVLFFNFIDHVYCEIYDGEQTKIIHFVQLEKVTYGFQLDEIIVTNNNKCIIYRARYQEQRNYIAEVFRFAIAKDLEIKVMSHFINPNDSDFRTKMIEQENSLKVVQQSTFKLIRNDRVIPPSPLLTYKGRIICDYLSTPLHGNFTYYISLGQNNIVQHKYPQNFVTIIPYMSDQFYLEETQCQTCLGLHVGKQLNYAYFGSSQERENFQNAIRARKSGVINLDVIFIHFEEDSLDRLVQFKRIKLKEINQRIESTEQQLQQLQSIKNELEMDVIEGELNSAVKLKYSSLMITEKYLYSTISGFDSPSFLQQK